MKRLIFILALLITSTTVAAAQTTSKDDSALTALIRQLANAQISFDAATIDRVLTSDYIEISPVGEFDPREKVLGFYKPELKPPAMPALDVSDFSIRSYGKFAIVITKLTYTSTVDGKQMPSRSMRATFVCRREKNEWKIASAQYTGMRPPQK